MLIYMIISATKEKKPLDASSYGQMARRLDPSSILRKYYTYLLTSKKVYELNFGNVLEYKTLANPQERRFGWGNEIGIDYLNLQVQKFWHLCL